MKYRLKVKVSKKMWKTGLIIYNTYEEAMNRKNELKTFGISSIIVDELGGNLK